jgi:hypothetical protein
MKKMSRLAAGLWIFLISVSALSALDNTDAKQVNTIRNQMIQTLVETGDEENKLKALDWVSRMVKEGSIDKTDEQIMTIIHNLATEPYLNPERQGIGHVIINDHYFVRLKTIKLLGSIGGPYATDALCVILQHEDDTDMLINTMYALARIGKNPDKSVTETLYKTVFRLSHLNKITNELAYSTLLVLESMSDKGNCSADSEVCWVLQTLNNDKYYNEVQSLCIRIMDKIWDAN